MLRRPSVFNSSQRRILWRQSWFRTRHGHVAEVDRAVCQWMFDSTIAKLTFKFRLEGEDGYGSRPSHVRHLDVRAARS